MISKSKRIIICFVVVALVFLVSRLFKMTEVPGSIYWDEASIGYNAYSVGVDGSDEWGSFLPVHFRAFGEFKLPVYVYSVAAVVKIFGLNAFSVRLPSVLFSFVTLVLVYFIVRKISEKDEVALLSMFLFAVLPWNFIFSRTGYEASAGLAFFVVGIYLFLFLKKNIWFLFASLVSFILSIYSYNSFRFISPLAFIFLCGGNYRDIVRRPKLVFVLAASIIIITFSLIPIARLYVLDSGAIRLTTLSLEGTPIEKTIQFTKNYLTHFSPQFLFFRGDGNLRSQIPGFGELYWISIPFVILGIYSLIKEKSKYSWLVILGLLVSFIPASLTRESPHSLRSITASFFYPIIIAYGITYVTKYAKIYRRVVLSLIVTIYIVFFSLYFCSFIRSYNFLSSEDWQYGYRNLILENRDLFARYNKVIISEEYAQPYIFALFYLKYSPQEFRASVKLTSVDRWGFSTVSSFGKFYFKKIEEEDFGQGNLVIDSKVNSGRDDCDKRVLFTDGKLAFCIYE